MANKREIALRFFWKMKDAGLINPDPYDEYYLYSPEGKNAIKAAFNAPSYWTAAFIANGSLDAADTPIKAVWLPNDPATMNTPGIWRFMELSGTYSIDLFEKCINAVAEKLGLDMSDDDYVDIDDLVF